MADIYPAVLESRNSGERHTMSALEKFLQHDENCNYQHWTKRNPQKCNCGLDEAEAELSALRAEVERLMVGRTKTIKLLREIENDEHCDNDGRGCGSGWRAGELADELENNAPSEGQKRE